VLIQPKPIYSSEADTHTAKKPEHFELYYKTEIL